MNPLVSIIIPTYNRAHLIGEALDSVLAQTYANWECIVVDDGSTDATETVVLDYVNKDSRFQYHKRPDSYKAGGNGARNYGFELSKGELVNWFDSDDLMKSELLSSKVTPFCINDDIDYVVSSFEIKFSETKIIGCLICNQSSNYLEDYLFDKSYLNSNNILWKKKSIDNKKWDEEILKFQDLDFIFRLLFQNNLTGIGIKEVLIVNRVHNDTISKKANFNVNWSRILVRKKMYELSKNEMSKKVISRLYQLYLIEIKNVLSKNDYRSSVKAVKAGVIINFKHKIGIYFFITFHYFFKSGIKLFSNYLKSISKY